MMGKSDYREDCNRAARTQSLTGKNRALGKRRGFGVSFRVVGINPRLSSPSR